MKVLVVKLHSRCFVSRVSILNLSIKEGFPFFQPLYNVNLIGVYIPGCEFRWSTQPTLKNIRGAGNISLVAATEMSAIPYQKIQQFANLLNLKFLSKTTFYANRSKYVFPAINRAWRKDKQKQMDKIREENRSLELALDGQCDSPGHCATYSTVSAMDTVNKILDFKIVHVREVTSSQAMEKEGFIRCLEDIQTINNLHVRVVSTDRHVSIKKLMRTDPRFEDILHQFDPWHVGKGLLKKLLKAGKKKGL